MATGSRTIAWIRRLVPMLVGAGLLYLGWLLVTANADLVEVDFLVGRVELAMWQVLGLSFAAGAALVSLYAAYQMARGGLVRRRYRKQLAGLETEVHQLRNLPLHAGEPSGAPANVPFEDDSDFAPERGGAGGSGA